MDKDRPQQVEGSAGWSSFFAWGVLLLVLLGWQTWVTLALFGGVAPWANLWNDQPLISGAHPQHLYLGSLGARAIRETGTNCVYDPRFQAGYPKTPIFDGSRLAELFLWVCGTERPLAATYKLGLATFCLAAPVLLLLTCWGVGASLPTSAVACALGLLVWWGPHGRAALEAGDAEMFLASLAVLAHIGLLIRFDREPGLRAWMGLFVTGALGWLAQPLLFPIVLPLLLIYYLSAGIRHPLPWHLALFVVEAAALGIQYPWMKDWCSYWWLRSELPSAIGLLPHRTLGAFWSAPLWGGSGHRMLAIFVFASASIGALIWNETKQRPAARLLGAGAVAFFGLAVLGISWEPLGQLGTSIFLSPALWFASIPASHGWVWCVTRMGRSTFGRWVLGAVALCLIGAGFVVREELRLIAARIIHTEPLTFGLGSAREDLVATLKQYTTADARILWEDRKLPRRASRWSALLPVLTERCFMGGLDPAGAIEHSSISFVDESLEGRHISLWTDKGLAEYCRRYNINSIVAWSPAVIQRLRSWSGTDKEIAVQDDVPGVFFLLKQTGPGYITRGQAQITHMDSQHIALADVVPVDGEVILNLHYLAGLKAAPSRVTVDREPCGHDPIGFIRLKMSGPVPRITLTWDRR